MKTLVVLLLVACSSQGPAGPAGADGAQGPQGPQGVAGASGSPDDRAAILAKLATPAFSKILPLNIFASYLNANAQLSATPSVIYAADGGYSVTSTVLPADVLPASAAKLRVIVANPDIAQATCNVHLSLLVIGLPEEGPLPSVLPTAMHVEMSVGQGASKVAEFSLASINPGELLAFRLERAAPATNACEDVNVLAAYLRYDSAFP